MAQIRPEDLPAIPGGTVSPTSAIIIDNGTGVFKATPDNVVQAAVPGIFEPTSGAAIIGANDNASGSLWTTVAGFIAYLRATTGGAIVGFSQAVSYVSASVGNFLNLGPVNVRGAPYNAAADGSTDDAAAIASAFARVVAKGGGDLLFPPGTYIAGSSLDGTSLANCRLLGYGATIKGEDATDFEYLLSLNGTTGVTVEGLTFDANKSGRSAASGKLNGVQASTSTRVAFYGCTFKNTLGITGMSGTSAIGLTISGGATAPRVVNCDFLDCGTSATTKPSDGLFMRANGGYVAGIYGSEVTDHVVALEGCNETQAIGIRGHNVTSIVAITNDTVSDCGNNQAIGISGSIRHFGSGGGPVNAITFSTGKLKNCLIQGVNIEGISGATGLGPGVYVAGNIEGVELTNIQVDPGASSGTLAQCIGIDITATGVGLKVNDCFLSADAVGTGIRIFNASSGISVENCLLEGGTYGIYADGTSSFSEFNNRFASHSVAPIGLAGSASYWGSQWQAWTPTYSSSAGDAATTFSGAVTTTLARINRVGRTVNVEVTFNATLNAVTPSYLALTLPSWAVPSDNNVFTPANVLDTATRETGEANGQTGGTIRVTRENGASFSSGAAVGARFTYSFECV